MHEELLTYHHETRWKCTRGSVLIIFTEFDFLNDAFVFSLRDSCIDFTAHSKYVLMTEKTKAVKTNEVPLLFITYSYKNEMIS